MKNGLSGKVFKEPKTIFPTNWSVEKILKVTWEVYEDSSIMPEGSKNFYKEKIIDGVKVKMYWTEKGVGSQVSDYINTIYPIVE